MQDVKNCLDSITNTLHIDPVNDFSDLLSSKNISNEHKALLIKAFEIGKTITERKYKAVQEGTKVTDAGVLASILYDRYKDFPQEEVYVVLLNTSKEVIGQEQVSLGTLDHVTLHLRDVFREAIKQHAHRIVLVHNHPSGKTYPTPQDNELTSVVKQAGRFLKIPLEDHIIIGDGQYYSYKQEGKL